MPALLLISPNRLHRDTLAATLGGWGFEVVAVGRTGEDALRMARELRPDAVLLDLPRADGLPTIRGLLAGRPDLAVVALGLPNDQREVVAWAEAGAAGFVLQDSSMEDLRLALEAALRGEVYCSPTLAATFVRRLQAFAANRVSNPGASTLTPREREIVTLIQQGLANKEIATRLGVELSTVKNHVHNILEKLRVPSRAVIRGRA